jgi:hypothetical protein
MGSVAVACTMTGLLYYRNSNKCTRDLQSGALSLARCGVTVCQWAARSFGSTEEKSKYTYYVSTGLVVMKEDLSVAG